MEWESLVSFLLLILERYTQTYQKRTIFLIIEEILQLLQNFGLMRGELFLLVKKYR